jgi:glucose/mannose-6-phosphate isomerase
MMLKELSLWAHKLKEGIQLADGFYQTHGAVLPKNIKKIVFVGMGGSGVAGRIMKTFLDRRPEITACVVDSPFVPAHIDTQTLAIVMSYSGNTWETLDILDDLTQKFIPTVVLAHAGQAAKKAELKGLPLALLPESLTPRSALGNFLGFLGVLFDFIGVLPNGKAMVTEWAHEADKYMPSFVDAAYFKLFLDIANGYDFFHVWGIAGDSGMAAYRATTQFNENAKVQAVFSQFPELAHNLLVGFEQFKVNPLVLFFYSDFLPAHMSTAIQATSEILAEKRVVLYKPPIFGDTFESQVFNMILWADFASYHLGHVRGVDVERVQIIEELKNRQKTKGIK